MFSTEHAPIPARRLLLLTALAAAAAAAAFLALRLAGQDLEVAARGEPQQVPVGAVVLATAAGGFAAAVLVRLAGRTSRPRRTFLIAVAAGLSLSAVPPVQAATTIWAAVWLLVLHAVVATVLVPPLARALPSHSARPRHPANSDERRAAGVRR